MDWKKELTKIILGLGITVVKALIPWLGTLLGGPLGFVASWAAGYLAGLLYDLVERYARFAAIDSEVLGQVQVAKTETAAFKAVQDNPASTPEVKNAAKEKLRLALIALGRVQLHAP
jgi:hypothetical protein